MKMNMPVMEIIKFDSNDVIATSGENRAAFYYSGYVGSTSGIGTDAWDNKISNEMLLEFKSQFPRTESTYVWYIYDYDTHMWSYHGKVKPIL